MAQEFTTLYFVLSLSFLYVDWPFSLMVSPAQAHKLPQLVLTLTLY